MAELTTAVVIVPPHEVQAVAVPLTLRYSPDMLIRLRPHITVSFPFVPFAELDAACDQLRQICADIAPFDLTMSGFGRFPNVIYMKPADPAPVQAVFERIFSAFPAYPPYEGRFGNTLSPHLTIAYFDPAQPPQTPPDYPAQRFLVDRLHVWYGPDDPALPWLTYDVIHLRAGA